MVGSVGGLLGALVAPWLARRMGTVRASTVLLVCRAQRAARRRPHRRRPQLPHFTRPAARRRSRSRRERHTRHLAPTLRASPPARPGRHHHAGGQLRRHATRRARRRRARHPRRCATGDATARRRSRPGLYQHPHHPDRAKPDTAPTTALTANRPNTEPGPVPLPVPRAGTVDGPLLPAPAFRAPKGSVTSCPRRGPGLTRSGSPRTCR